MPCIFYLYNFKSKDYKEVIYKFVIFNLFIQKCKNKAQVSAIQNTK